MNIPDISNTATLSPEGYWITNFDEQISYTENGHNLIEESEGNSFWYKHRLNCLQQMLTHYPSDELLDIGGGNGQVTKFLQDQNIESVLLEPMINGVLNAQKKGINHIIWGSLESLEMKENSVSAAGLFDVLEHIEDDRATLAGISRILKPGGQLFLTVPALQFLYSDFDKEVGHYRRYTLRDLSDKLSENGFEVCYKTYLFFPLPFVIWPVRKFYRLIKKKKKRRKLGHINKKSFSGKLINIYLRLETFLLKRKIRIPFGSTCLIVACKK